MKLPDVVVANRHKRYTGVSATVAALVPRQRAAQDIAVVDSGGLGLPDTWPLWRVAWLGWTLPANGRWRVWHARRDVEMLLGLFLTRILRQRWRLVFTSAAPRRHGWVLRQIMARMDAIIATSERAASFLDWYSVVIPHGVDTDVFRPAEDREAALAEAGLAGRLVIGAFGRLRPSKGTDLLIEALVQVLPRHPDGVAVLTGLAADKDLAFVGDLRNRIAAAGLTDRIRLEGDLPMEEVRRWYQRISLCVAASRSEGFGLTPLEAFASGAAAVTSSAGAWPWLVTDDIGRVVETGSATALADALEEMLVDRPRLAQMGKAARQAAITRFSIAQEAAAINAVYRTLQAGPLEKLPPPEQPDACQPKAGPTPTQGQGSGQQ